MSQPFQLKNIFNEKLVIQLSQQIKKVYQEFNDRNFTQKVINKLEPLELKERSALISHTLIDYLPKDFSTSAQILINALGPELIKTEDNGYDGFYVMPLTSYIAQHGLQHGDLETSMKALYEMTKRFTAEFDIRVFLTTFPQQVMKYLETWVNDSNAHIRRLVSEGTRPRLPWASRLPQFQKHPEIIIPLLKKLKNDPELYVRRSVANNLNDITKDNPDIVIKALKAWLENPTKEIEWIAKHALRSLIKQGHPEALKLLGYDSNPRVEVTNLELNQFIIQLGDSLSFTFELTSISTEMQPQKLMIDYVLYFMKANGKLSPKVFKLSQKQLKPNTTIVLKKKHSFKPISTRKYYPGQHRLAIQINGNIKSTIDFTLNE